MAVSQRPANAGVSPTFQLQDVTVKHNGRAVLERITVDIPRGKVTALVGPSGAGKSTLLRVLNRFEDPSQGSVAFSGAPMSSRDPALLRRRVGLLSQRPVALAENVADDLRVGAADLSDSDVIQLLRRVDLAELSPGQGTAALSGGELQRLALARALAVQPRLEFAAAHPSIAAATEQSRSPMMRTGCAALSPTRARPHAQSLATQHR